MLVLSRKKDESILLNDNIVITIVDIRGDKVRLGVEAPREVLVNRKEIYDALHRQDPPAPVPPATRNGRTLNNKSGLK